MPTLLDIILYDDYILKNQNKINYRKQSGKQSEKQSENKKIIEENKKIILDSFVNYPRLELIKKYKIQTYQFLMNKNYRNSFFKLLIIPMTCELCYNIFLKKV
jgi:hypothetical protein